MNKKRVARLFHIKMWKITIIQIVIVNQKHQKRKKILMIKQKNLKNEKIRKNKNQQKSVKK